MWRLTLRLPDTLHHELESHAQREKVSLNQYLVYALTRQVAVAYTVTPAPADAVEQQREAFAVLLRNLGQESPTEVQRALGEREHAELEPELPAETASRLRQRIAASFANS